MLFVGQLVYHADSAWAGPGRRCRVGGSVLVHGQHTHCWQDEGLGHQPDHAVEGTNQITALC